MQVVHVRTAASSVVFSAPITLAMSATPISEHYDDDVPRLARRCPSRQAGA
jgi:hypothetical protein